MTLLGSSSYRKHGFPTSSCSCASIILLGYVLLFFDLLPCPRGGLQLCFAGVLFICFNVDHKLLWAEQLTEEIINDGFQFYTTFYNSPPAIKVSL